MKKIFFFYLLSILSLCFFSYAFVDPNLIYLHKIYSGFYIHNKLFTTLAYLLFLLILFVFYFLFLQLLHKNLLSSKLVWKIISVTAFILFLSYPAMLSYDIFNYTTTAKTAFFYKENPYIVMPIEFVKDPDVVFTRAANKIALYGPFWIILTAVPYLLGFGNFITILFGFKLLILCFYLLTTFLIWKLSKSLLSVVLFSLNPLVMIETLISSHNDIVMIGLVMLSYYFVRKKRLWLAILFFVLSIFIKYATIVLLPIFLFILWKSVNDQKIKWDSLYYFSSFAMMIVFILSPIREEIYPWYAIWFLAFTALAPNKKYLLYLSLSFSFSLLLRYVPFMYSGTYAGSSSILKTLLTFIVPLLTIICLFWKESLWRKLTFRF